MDTENTDTTYYEKQVRLPIDSKRVMIFTLKESKVKNWYARIRKQKGSGYYQRSLKTTNIEEAKREATKLYMELWAVEDKGVEFIDAKFSDCFKAFLKDYSFSPSRRKRVTGIFTRYFSQ